MKLLFWKGLIADSFLKGRGSIEVLSNISVYESISSATRRPSGELTTRPMW
jgi:hypothetical protein